MSTSALLACTHLFIFHLNCFESKSRAVFSSLSSLSIEEDVQLGQCYVLIAIVSKNFNQHFQLVNFAVSIVRALSEITQIKCTTYNLLLTLW